MKLRPSVGGLLALALALTLCPPCMTAGAEESAAAHTHIWRTDWAMDDYRHWHGCADPSCRTLVPSQAEGFGYHRYDDDRDAVCNDCGWVRAVDPGHEHTWGEGWNSDRTGHWRRCTDPDCPGVTPGAPEGYQEHVYDGPEDPTCNVCGRNRFLDPSHTHVWGTDWSVDSRGHWRVCTDPDCPGVAPEEGKDYALHVYNGSQDPVCAVCGRRRYVDAVHTHVWGTEWSGNDDAHWYACTAPGCPGVVPGEGKGHAAHVYDGDLDVDCNVCGRVRVVLPPSGGELAQPPIEDADLVTEGRGVVSVRPVERGKGTRVTVILTPGEHCVPYSLTVTDQDGKELEALPAGEGRWTFVHPGERVRMRAVFLPSYEACPQDGSCPLAAYGDLDPARWYHDGLHYCLDWDLMRGYDPSKFVPDDGLSGGMVAQILYNMAGRPELPARTDYESTDVWYDNAVAWAVGAGVMNAEGGRLFSPEEEVTREQFAVMLWRCAARPGVPGWSRPFSDAGAVTPWMEESVRWAVDRGILHGRADGRLDPGGRITRAEAGAMLVRFQSETRFIWK